MLLLMLWDTLDLPLDPLDPLGLLLATLGTCRLAPSPLGTH